jgi:hypothetical protein
VAVIHGSTPPRRHTTRPALCAGQTYEREAIENWIATQQARFPDRPPVDPCTRAPLVPATLTPIVQLRQLVERWREGRALTRGMVEGGGSASDLSRDTVEVG